MGRTKPDPNFFERTLTFSNRTLTFSNRTFLCFRARLKLSWAGLYFGACCVFSPVFGVGVFFALSFLLCIFLCSSVIFPSSCRVPCLLFHVGLFFPRCSLAFIGSSSFFSPSGEPGGPLLDRLLSPFRPPPPDLTASGPRPGGPSTGYHPAPSLDLLQAPPGPPSGLSGCSGGDGTWGGRGPGQAFVLFVLFPFFVLVVPALSFTLLFSLALP